MGKKNKKKSKNFDDSDPMYNQERNNHIADSLEYLISEMDAVFIRVGRDAEEIEAAEEVVRKACKNLRNGKPEKVFDPERFDELIEQSNWG